MTFASELNGICNASEQFKIARGCKVSSKFRWKKLAKLFWCGRRELLTILITESNNLLSFELWKKLGWKMHSHETGISSTLNAFHGSWWVLQVKKICFPSWKLPRLTVLSCYTTHWHIKTREKNIGTACVEKVFNASAIIPSIFSQRLALRTSKSFAPSQNEGQKIFSIWWSKSLSIWISLSSGRFSASAPDRILETASHLPYERKRCM